MPSREELSREPFWEDAPPEHMRGSISSPVGVPRRDVDPATGEVKVWPPRTSGPLPKGWQTAYPDVNVVTALDELDLWAAELDRQSHEYAAFRRDYAQARHRFELERAKARRRVMADAAHVGSKRPTVDQINDLIVEAVHHEHQLFLDAEAELDVAKTLLFAARDQIERLRTSVSAAKVLDPRGPG